MGISQRRPCNRHSIWRRAARAGLAADNAINLSALPAAIPLFGSSISVMLFSVYLRSSGVSTATVRVHTLADRAVYLVARPEPDACHHRQ